MHPGSVASPADARLACSSLQAAQPGINELADIGQVAQYKQYPQHSWTNIYGTPQTVEPASQVDSQVQQAEQQLGPNQQQQLQQLQQQQEQQQQQQHGRKLAQAQARRPPASACRCQLRAA